MRFFLFSLAATAAMLFVIALAGCGDGTTNAVVIPPALAIPTLDVTTDVSDINHGTRVDITVSNPTDQAIEGIILAVEQSATRNVDVFLWYGFSDQWMTKTVLVEPGQKYHPGLTVCYRNSEWLPINDDIFSEDGFIIGRLAPHETVETRSWFIKF